MVVAELEAEPVPGLAVRKATEETGRLAGLAVLIFGSRAVAVRAGEQALAVELGLVTERPRDLVPATGQDLGPAQAVELDQGSDRVAVQGRAAERAQVVEPVRVRVLGLGQAPETKAPKWSLRGWADGAAPRHY